MSACAELYAEFISDVTSLPARINVAVYGTGKVGQGVVLALKKCRPDISFDFYFDSFNKGSQDGSPIYVFADNKSLARKVDIVIIASAFWPDIEKILIDAAVRNYIICNADPMNRSLFNDDQQKHYAPTVEANLQSLEDYSSRETYKVCYAMRCMFVPRRQQADVYKTPDSILDKGGQYLRYVNWNKVYTAIDGGVFDGKTTEDFLQKMPPGALVIGFEADQSNVEKFNLRNQFAGPSRKLEARALWRSNCLVELTPLGSASSTREGTPNQTGLSVPAITLDEYVRTNGLKKIDLIKLDVEGSETAILEGAEETIREHRPQLAICIYHSAAEFATIPELLRTTLPGYKHYVAHYGKEIFDETVWYSIPEECVES
ncbi:hypothetical protein NNJEOMEG_02814 [Fundidesulfovibrio magnetotacticus]|uniref:Methyltransferase FkbM domain-containing protein n=1 Tax=Fundidesulfovibrio magnetotacticus TaxID=2730080 RepID=A0A6V8LYU8_9BACT|nr:FkbM family methyltransferase [Fundidesulfovibrio magnetotacticus]GFK94966.1 hypothetical protein NNJEOMEG_02814 [Fundidesulfovibrio magnetotacticus]